MHRSLWVQVTHSSLIEGSHMTKNTASGQVSARLPFERKQMGRNRTISGIKGTGLVQKIQLIKAQEWKAGINDIVQNNHKWYLTNIIIHYHSYFINEIKLLNHVCTIKSHSLSLNLNCLQKYTRIWSVCSSVFGQDLMTFPQYRQDLTIFIMF